MARPEVETPTPRAASSSQGEAGAASDLAGEGASALALRRMTRLQLTTAALADATTRVTVGAILLRDTCAVLSALAGAVLELSPGSADLVPIASFEDGVGVLGGTAAVALASASPVARAAREHTTFWVDAEHEDGRAAGVLGRLPPGNAWIAVPLEVDGRAVGVIALAFSGPRTFCEEERATILAIAGEGARALERAWVFEALNEANVRLGAIVRAAPLGIALLDPDGTVRFWNPAAARIFGVPAERAVGAFHPAIGMERRAEYLARLDGVARGAVGDGQSFRQAGGNGSPIDLEVWAARVDDGRGHVQLLAMIADATARARAERMQRFLAESSAVLASAIDYERGLETLAKLAIQGPATLAMIDGPRRNGSLGVIAVAYADRALEKLLRELRERDSPGEDGALSRVLKAGDAHFAAEIDEPLFTAFGVRSPYPEELSRLRMRSLMIVPLIARGRPLGAISLVSMERAFTREEFALARELGARAALHVDNARLIEEAREAVWLRDDFLGIAGHELKTPITALQLALQSLARTSLSEPTDSVAAVKRIALCHRQIERLSKLVDQLLDVSRITAGRLILELEDVDVAEVVNEAVARMSEDLARAGCDVAIHADTPLVGRWDRMRLDQIVTNLLSNALKYGKGKPVTLEVRRVGEGVSLSVRDQGIGIALEDQARIFDRFERAVSQRNYGGLGLGLWIVHQIVEALGGTVTVQSSKGSGATFTVELPPTSSNPR